MRDFYGVCMQSCPVDESVSGPPNNSLYAKANQQHVGFLQSLVASFDAVFAVSGVLSYRLHRRCHTRMCGSLYERPENSPMTGWWGQTDSDGPVVLGHPVGLTRPPNQYAAKAVPRPVRLGYSA